MNSGDSFHGWTGVLLSIGGVGQMARFTASDRGLLVGSACLGSLLGPMAYFLALQLALPAGAPGPGLDPVGVAWALVSVAAFAIAGVLNRLVADKGWGAGLTIGLSSLLAALVFGVITLLVFGPAQFLHLRWW